MKGVGQGGFQEIHQVDVIGRRDAQKFLEASLRTWEAKPHPRGRFFQSLLDGESFPWWLYLNSTKWGAGAGAAGAGVRHVLVAGTLQPPRLLHPVHMRRGHHWRAERHPKAVCERR